MSNNSKPCEFNNYINIILLIMFVIVVSVAFSYKSCTSSSDKNAGDGETVEQPHADVPYDSINSSKTINK